ncbi:TAM domain methyltransferase [Colletotrichum orchidophilum]|uniref:TAM domain methyltransferase n=1 Tax=Colletotrichum orchidophilum TaxID=1209926 RepID=A0A1G4B0S3_9PEZI|nr:TAM domain methyltransferase [Colletotrichum orchidophilum]OHE94977.1 TAM domain methyltransferase [Colletotrichum orchidophilum]
MLLLSLVYPGLHRHSYPPSIASRITRSKAPPKLPSKDASYALTTHFLALAPSRLDSRAASAAPKDPSDPSPAATTTTTTIAPAPTAAQSHDDHQPTSEPHRSRRPSGPGPGPKLDAGPLIPRRRLLERDRVGLLAGLDVPGLQHARLQLQKQASVLPPEFVPPNLRFMVDDADVKWPKLFAGAYRSYKKRPAFQNQEARLNPEKRAGSTTATTARCLQISTLVKMVANIKETLVKLDIKMNAAKLYPSHVAAAGFVNLALQVQKVPVGPLARDDILKKIRK